MRVAIGQTLNQQWGQFEMARRKQKIATQSVGSMPAREGDDLTDQTNFDEVKAFTKSFFKNGTMPLMPHEVKAKQAKADAIANEKRLIRNMKARLRRRKKARENAPPKPKPKPKPKAEPKKHQPRFKVRTRAQREARRGRKS